MEKIKRILIESGCTNNGCPNSKPTREWHDAPCFPFGPEGDVLRAIGDRAVEECSHQYCHNNLVMEVIEECFADNTERIERIRQRVLEKLGTDEIEGLISLARWYCVPTE